MGPTCTYAVVVYSNAYAAQLYLIGLEQEARHMIAGKSRFGFAASEYIGPVGIRPIWVGDLTRAVWFVEVVPNA
jgi:hypothetical protein